MGIVKPPHDGINVWLLEMAGTHNLDVPSTFKKANNWVVCSLEHGSREVAGSPTIGRRSLKC
jgi:hypothetical protein